MKIKELPIEEMGLVPGHAYSIIKVKEVTTKEGKLKKWTIMLGIALVLVTVALNTIYML